MTIIIRMENSEWFKENAGPYGLSQAQDEKIVEDLKALGAD